MITGVLTGLMVSPAERPVSRPSNPFEIPTATVRWCDSDGQLLPDEPAIELDQQRVTASISGIKVSLRDGCNTEIAQTATDEVGGFLFEGVSAGEYTVVLTLPSSEDDRPALPPVQTWTGGSDGYRLTGRLS